VEASYGNVKFIYFVILFLFVTILVHYFYFILFYFIFLQYGTLRMCGFDVLQPQISYATKLVDESTRLQYIEDWKCRLQTIFSEKPLDFPKLSDFDPKTLMFHTENGSKPITSIGHRYSEEHNVYQ
jgi:hypothetical protein